MHMPRAAGAFGKAGFEVVAVPADFHSGWGEGYPLEKWLPSADNLRNSMRPCTSLRRLAEVAW